MLSAVVTVVVTLFEKQELGVGTDNNHHITVYSEYIIMHNS
jgi:hypothetical protein